MGVKKNFKCIYCGRLFVVRSSHKCRGTLRKKNLAFVDRSNIIWKEVTEWKSFGTKKWNEI